MRPINQNLNYEKSYIFIANIRINYFLQYALLRFLSTLLSLQTSPIRS